jgi:hypothetical protein
MTTDEVLATKVMGWTYSDNGYLLDRHNGLGWGEADGFTPTKDRNVLQVVLEKFLGNEDWAEGLHDKLRAIHCAGALNALLLPTETLARLIVEVVED